MARCPWPPCGNLKTLAKEPLVGSKPGNGILNPFRTLPDPSTPGKSNLLSGQTHLDLKGNLISNAGELKLINQTQLNIKDLNATLNQKSDLDLHLNADYLNPKLKDQNTSP